MSHFAKIDINNIVEQVIVADNDFPNEGYDWVVGTFGGTWVQTSYNAKFRKNFAGIGYTYDAERDAFIEPKPFPSWVLNEETCKWEAPIPYPTDGSLYEWNEDNTNWKLSVLTLEN